MAQRIDEAFLPLSEMIEHLADLEGFVSGVKAGEVIAMEIEEAKFGLPIQMEVAIDNYGKVLLGSVPPLYDLETSFIPVFHQISLSMSKNDKE